MVKTLGYIEILDEERVSFADLVESPYDSPPDSPRPARSVEHIHIIANLPALQADLRSLYFRLTEEMGGDF